VRSQPRAIVLALIAFGAAVQRDPGVQRRSWAFPATIHVPSTGSIGTQPTRTPGDTELGRGIAITVARGDTVDTTSTSPGARRPIIQANNLLCPTQSTGPHWWCRATARRQYKCGPRRLFPTWRRSFRRNPFLKRAERICERSGRARRRAEIKPAKASRRDSRPSLKAANVRQKGSPCPDSTRPRWRRESYPPQGRPTSRRTAIRSRRKVRAELSLACPRQLLPASVPKPMASGMTA